MPFELTFNGSFFHMAAFLRRLDRFVAAGGKTVRIGGRLLTIEGIVPLAGAQGLPAGQGDGRRHRLPGARLGGRHGRRLAVRSGQRAPPRTASASGTTPATPSATVTP